MNYPVWNVPWLGSGLVVAIIAIIHILISHLAIGGGAFLAVAEIWSNHQKDNEKIREWLHKFATFFLVYTTVFGAITGVGIWFSIQLASPEGTSLLIHQFVFAWAFEWVAFLGELTTLYLYYYGWKTNSRKMQVFLAVSYFVIAWISLFIINGILSFMLTPGKWTLANTNIAAGFFNPGFFPSLFIRTFAMFLIAGLAGILIATKISNNDNLKERIIAFCTKWVIPGAALIPIFTIWYWTTLPESTVNFFQSGVVGVAGGKMEAITRFFWLAAICGALIIVGTFVVAARPKATHMSTAIALLIIAQLGIMGAEFFREMARKPYVVHGVLYSNSLWKHNADKTGYLNESYLKQAKWDPPLQQLSQEHGKWIYRLQCASCHTINGYRGLNTRTKEWSPPFGVRFLEKLNEQKVMPPFQGNLEDRAALTSYLISIHGKNINGAQVLKEIQP